MLSDNLQNNKKLKIGWFSFSCCEDSTIMFTEMLNDNFFEWKKIFDIKYFNAIQKRKEINNIDVAFIEGAVSSPSQEREVKEIRRNAKRVVTIGSCATTGLPAGQRNNFDEDTGACIEYLLRRFGQNTKVQSIPEVVEVDDKVAGCPMNEQKFLEVITKYLKEFGIV